MEQLKAARVNASKAKEQAWANLEKAQAAVNSAIKAESIARKEELRLALWETYALKEQAWLNWRKAQDAYNLAQLEEEAIVPPNPEGK